MHCISALSVVGYPENFPEQSIHVQYMYMVCLCVCTCVSLEEQTFSLTVVISLSLVHQSTLTSIVTVEFGFASDNDEGHYSDLNSVVHACTVC